MIRFFRFIGRLLGGLVKALQAVFFLVFLALLIAIFAGLGGAIVKVPETAALIIAPTGVLVEQAEGQPLSRALLQAQSPADGQTVVRDIVQSLRLAAEDERIGAVVLVSDFLAPSGLSKLQAVGDALDEFRESGKRVIAMGDNFDQTQYYLAAHADEIYMHDFGVVFIEGFSYFRAYFKEAIDKLNIDVNVFKVGDYKSFVEPYTRNSMSENDKLASQRWVGALWSMWRRDVAAARGLSAEQLDTYIDDWLPMLQAVEGDAGKVALKAGIIDGLKSRAEFRAYMTELVGPGEEYTDTYAHIDFRSYLLAREFEDRGAAAAENKIAVIVASGTIVDGEADPGTVGGDTLARLIRETAADETIDAVVLRVDSPGGSMFASEVILDELEALQATGKPVVASMSTLAASGGYYISMPADAIFAAESTISGSIGVGAIFPTFQRSLQSLGVNIDGFGTTKAAGALNGVRELDEDTRRFFELSVSSAYDLFIGKVAEAREMDTARVDEIAQGRVWIGADALEIGLVDKLGGLDDAIAAAAEYAGLPADSWDVVYVQEELSLAEQMLLQYASLLDQLFSFANIGNHGLLSRLLGIGTELQNELVGLESWNDPRGIYLHCFCAVR